MLLSVSLIHLFSPYKQTRGPVGLYRWPGFYL